MSNPLFEQINNNQNSINPMLQQFLNFKQSFSGDPKQTVQNLLNTGMMSQQQFNQLAQQATQLQKMFNL